MKEFVWKREVNYIWERTLVKLVKPVVLFLVDTPITPNMITFINLLLCLPFVLWACYLKNYFLIAIGIQLYAIFDVLDGNLARNKNMSSKLGKILDYVADTLFYIIGYIAIGIALELEIIYIVGLVVIHQLYGLIATYYIVPSMRKMDIFNHTKLKKYFEQKGIIFGMDATLQCCITSILLVFPLRKYIFDICSMLWIVDLLYRIYELKWCNREHKEGK